VPRDHWLVQKYFHVRLKSATPNFLGTGRGQRGLKGAAEHSLLQRHSKGRVGCVCLGATGKSIC
jgi:hypothetical protein